MAGFFICGDKLRIFRAFSFDLDGSKSRLKEFVWRTPVMRPVQVSVPYYSDTKENKAARYAFVCAGGSDNPMPAMPETKENIKFHVRWRRGDDSERNGYVKNAVSIYAIANQYTQENKSRQVGYFELSHLRTLDESKFVEQEIKRIISHL